MESNLIELSLIKFIFIKFLLFLITLDWTEVIYGEL